jgi:hypothetical protein
MESQMADPEHKSCYGLMVFERSRTKDLENLPGKVFSLPLTGVAGARYETMKTGCIP